MSTILSHIRQAMFGNNAPFSRLIGEGDAFKFSWEWQERQNRFNEYEALYNNTIYRADTFGGMRDLIFSDYLEQDCPASLPIGGFYNPVKGIVDCYQNVLRGQWGREIKVAETVQGRDVNPKLLALSQDNPIGKIWGWGNFDTHKQPMQEMAAKLGTVGIRVNAEKNQDGQNRVYLTIDHPGIIKDYEQDARGNLTDVVLAYTRMEGELGEEREEVAYTEYLTRESFRTLRNGKPFGETIPNELGVCPYVLLKHADSGEEWGRPAHAGSEVVIHEINAIIARQKRAVHRYSYPHWFAASAGAAPENHHFDEESMTHVRLQPGDPTPVLTPKVAPIQHQDILAVWTKIIQLLSNRQPELILYEDVKLLSGISGEAIAQVLKPTEQVIELAKANYEHALKRALKIGLSWGIMLGLWELGTGQGTRQAADRAFESGREDFEFVPRPPLPLSIYDQVVKAKADNAEEIEKFKLAQLATQFADATEPLIVAGYDEATAKRIAESRKREQKEIAEVATAGKVQQGRPKGKSPKADE